MDDTKRRRLPAGSRARLALAAAVLGAALVVAAVAAGVAIRASERAAAADDVAASRALAAAAMRNLHDEPDLAMLLALEALRRVGDRPAAESYEARSSLVSALTRHPHLAAVLHVDGGAAAVEFSSDGRLLATSDGNGTTRLWDVRRRAQLGRAMQGQGSCYTLPVEVDVRFTPGDKALVQTACGVANVFDPSSGRKVRVLGGPTDDLGEEETDGLLSPDGRVLVFEGEYSGTRVLDLETGKAILENPAPSDAYRYHDAISGDSRVLATSRSLSSVEVRRSTLLTSLRSGAPFARLVPGLVLALSPHGDVAVVVGSGTVSLWSVARGRAIGSPLPVHDVLRAAFAPNGRRLAVSSDDGSVHVWSLTRTWRPHAPIRLRHGGVRGLRFDPSGNTLATGAPDGQVRLWDVTTPWPLLERIGATAGTEVAFSPDGELLVASLDEGTAIWRTLPGGRVGNVHTVDEGIGSDIAFSRDGRMVSVYNDPGAVVTWDVAAKRVTGEVETWEYEMDDGAAFSPDGRFVAASDDWGLRLWDRASGRRSGKALAGFDPLAFSADGSLLLSGSQSWSGVGDEKHTLRFWDVEKRQLLHVSSQGSEPLDFAFSPNGKTLAVAEEDRAVGLWDVRRRTPIDRLNLDPSSADCCYRADVEFTPDGSTLAIALTTSLTLWDTASRARLGDPVRTGNDEYTDELWDVDVRPDGRALAVAGVRGIFLLDALLLSRDPGIWSRRLCGIANRELTEHEGRRYLGGESSHETCGGG